ncbi:MAG: TetR/AcrR family transcriptional regulator [Desulfobacterales bacterium]|nr:TetR/AcrR family transcriptional regulator [Desulfobacterales bacterium]
MKERRELEKQMRRSQILDAARNLLFSHGIENVSISKISKEAELGVGTIYFHYKNKEEIFIALQQEGLSIFYSIISQIAQKDDAAHEQLRQIADAYYEFCQSQSEYYNIINYFLSSSKVFFQADLKQQVDMAGSKILRVIQNIVVSGIEDGLFDEKEPAKFSAMFWGTLHGLFQFKKLEQTALGNQDHKGIYDYSVEKLIRGILST